MGEFDAAGEIVTGTLLGRAVERPSHDGEGHDGLCLNCGTALIGAHCHRCGQGAHAHRSIGEIWHEILHGVVHFDGKLWRTLPLLAGRPGELTRRYVEGERARFVSPMALFLFSLFTMFAVFQIAGISPPADLNLAGQSAANFETARENLTVARKTVTDRLADMAPDDPDRAEAMAKLTEVDRSLAALDTVEPAVTHGKAEVHTGWHRLDHGIEKAVKNPGLALYKLQSNSYKFSWLLIPLSLPFVWLMFAWKRQYNAYDHAVFITYSIAFMSLLFIAITIAGSIGAPAPLLALVAVLVPPIHIYKHLKGAYQLRRSTALLRTAVLLIFTVIVLSLFLTLLILLGLVG